MQYNKTALALSLGLGLFVASCNGNVNREELEVMKEELEKLKLENATLTAEVKELKENPPPQGPPGPEGPKQDLAGYAEKKELKDYAKKNEVFTKDEYKTEEVTVITSPGTFRDTREKRTVVMKKK